jgi:hypothetical protein
MPLPVSKVAPVHLVYTSRRCRRHRKIPGGQVRLGDVESLRLAVPLQRQGLSKQVDPVVEATLSGRDVRELRPSWCESGSIPVWFLAGEGISSTRTISLDRSSTPLGGSSNRETRLTGVRGVTGEAVPQSLRAFVACRRGRRGD